MNGFGILMFLFATSVLLVGFYMYRGHKIGMLAWRAGFQNLDKNGWKNVGKWTMISSILIYLLSLLGFFFDF